jgi:hypothetical protein
LSLRRDWLPSGSFRNRAIRIALAPSMAGGLTMLSHGFARDAAASTNTLCSPSFPSEVPVVSHPTR